MKEDMWLYEWYAFDKHAKKIVYGFDDKQECAQYCKKHKYSQNSYMNMLLKQNVTPNVIDNWTDDWPEPDND